MKHIAMALMLWAIPATAFAQDAGCNGCGHVAPYFRGSGGFIGTVADGVDQVTFVALCGGVSITGEAQVNGGTASQLFNQRNGLACDREGGALEIAGLEDGGWYWINDTHNSAVGNLLSKDVLDNQTTELTRAGDSVTMSVGRGAVFLKHTGGRVGILPNILPVPEQAPPRTCGFDVGGTASNPTYSRRSSECALGDGGTIVLATTTGLLTGATARVVNGGALVRPGGSGSVVVTVDVWGNHSGFFVTARGGNARLGQPSAGLSGGRDNRLTGVTYGARLGAGPTGAALAHGTARAGITMDTNTAPSVVTFSIAADSAYCSRTNNHSATVAVTASMAFEIDTTQVTPAIARDPGAGAVGATSFTVVCP